LYRLPVHLAAPLRMTGPRPNQAFLCHR
jgi:hypothetical protein